jgi:hypothetical protein
LRDGLTGLTPDRRPGPEKMTITKNTDDQQQQILLDWTAKQGRILTDEGKATEYYCSERGFPFALSELPHYHLERGETHQVFHRWAAAATQSPIVGAWTRPLFIGKWEHSTNNEEIVYNIQTSSLFIDLRIPTCKPVSRWEKLLGSDSNEHIRSSRQVIESMSDEDLRLYARQHAFAGYAVISQEKNNQMNNLPLCTRHHCIDWNYVSGKPRPRPNKWFIEGKSDGKSPFNVWKEWSYATDQNGQCYYWERWERIDGDDFGKGLRLAMRRKGKRKQVSCKKEDVDAILVAVGDHFNFIVGRQYNDNAHTRYRDANNTAELVDSSLQQGDRDTAISYLSSFGGHGTISSGWKVDCALQSWQHGLSVFDCLQCNNEDVKVGSTGDACTSWEVVIGDDFWEVYECSLCRDGLQQLLLSPKKSRL